VTERARHPTSTPSPDGHGNVSNDSGFGLGQEADGAGRQARLEFAVVAMLARDALQQTAAASSTLASASETVLSSSPTSQATALAALNLIDAVRQQVLD